MSPGQTQNLSKFGQTAVMLDHDFAELERLSGQIVRLDINSDSGLDQAHKLLIRFTECAQRITEGVQGIAETIGELRTRSEQAALQVAERANQVQERRMETDRMQERFRSLGEEVRKITTAMTEFKKPADTSFSAEEKTQYLNQLTEIDSKMGPVIEQARKLEDDAHQSGMTSLERKAESLAQSVEAAHRKLSRAIDDVR